MLLMPFMRYSSKTDYAYLRHWLWRKNICRHFSAFQTKPKFLFTCWNRNISGYYISFSTTVRSSRMQVENEDHMQKFTVAVEGNIGSGKTTLLQYFTKYSTAMVFQEPVCSWRNVDGHNLLDLMYSDPEKWSFTFQSYVQLTMAQLHLKEHDYFASVKLMERSIFSAKYCFVENLYRSRKLAEPDYVVLTKWFEFLISNKNIHLDLIVYLRARPTTVFQRIQKRCRAEEKGISLDYLEALHTLHEDWLIKKKFEVPCSVLVLDADCSLDELESLCHKHANEILFSATQQPLSFSQDASIHFQ